MKRRDNQTVMSLRAEKDGFSIEPVRARDYAFWRSVLGINRLEFAGKLVSGLAFVIRYEGVEAGLMYHSMLWDSVPLLNMVFVRGVYRGRGAGRFAVEYWEKLMKKRGFDTAMVCVPSDMSCQQFYRGCGYEDCGSVTLQRGGRRMPADLFMVKYL